MTDQKKPKLTPEEEAVLFDEAYKKLCKERGFVHRAIPFPTETAIIQAKLEIVLLATQTE